MLFFFWFIVKVNKIPLCHFPVNALGYLKHQIKALLRQLCHHQVVSHIVLQKKKTKHQFVNWIFLWQFLLHSIIQICFITNLCICKEPLRKHKVFLFHIAWIIWENNIMTKSHDSVYMYISVCFLFKTDGKFSTNKTEHHLNFIIGFVA